MYWEGLLQFDPAAGTSPGTGVTITGSTSYTSTNILDLGVGRDPGVGDDPSYWLHVLCLAASGAGRTLIVGLQYAADNAGSPGTWYNAAISETFSATDLVANTALWDIPLPMAPPEENLGSTTYPRFMQLTYTTHATGDSITLSAGLVLHPPAIKLYKPGIAIAN
jgi:hypothetical protein